MFMHSHYFHPRLCANFVIFPRTNNRAALDIIPLFCRFDNFWLLSMQPLSSYHIVYTQFYIYNISIFIFNNVKQEVPTFQQE